MASGGSKRTELHHALYALMIEELWRGPRSRADLERITGLCHGAIAAHLRALRRRRLVHIERWVQNARGERRVPEYRFAPGRTDARPVKLTLAQRCKIYRRKRALVAAGAPMEIARRMAWARTLEEIGVIER